MKTDYTPAPWLVDFDLDEFDSRRSTLKILDSRDLDHPQGALMIATVNVAAHAPHLDEPLANARLIAAAPDLLAALSWFISELSDDSAIDMSKLINEMETRARAAIAKATATN